MPSSMQEALCYAVLKKAERREGLIMMNNAPNKVTILILVNWVIILFLVLFGWKSWLSSNSWFVLVWSGFCLLCIILSEIVLYDRPQGQVEEQ